MDFSDDKARVVVVVGIPFPNVYDVKVSQKKKFNDTYESSRNLLSGNEWYCQQAFRALNQATGRCIRHRFDYGAVIYLDERFHRDRNRAYISKWLRNSIRLYSSFEESLDGLKSFFSDVKVRIGVTSNSSQELEVECEKIESVEKKNSQVPKSGCHLPKEEPVDISFVKKERTDISSIKKDEVIDVSEGDKAYVWARPSVPVAKYNSPSTQTRNEVITLKDDKRASFCREYIDLECDSDKDSRPATPSVEMSSDDPELTIVKETPATSCRRFKPTPELFSTNYISSAVNNHVSTSSPQILSFGRNSSQNNLHASPVSFMCSSVTTPKQEISPMANSITPEAESVNNNISKRRKVDSLLSIGSLQVSDMFSSVASSITLDANHHSENTKCDTWNKCDGLHVPPGVNMDERLKMSCSRCKNPLGLPENDLFVMCSPMSTSKAHLMSLQKKAPESVALNKSSVDILLCDLSSVDSRLCGTAQEGVSGQGIWCKEDGCVFSTLFCPFCVYPDNYLGVQVLATDALNVKFQNKILFYRDRLEIQMFEGAKEEAVSPEGDSSTLKNVDTHAFESYSYISPIHDSTGWRSTKSRMRLPTKR